MNPHELLNARRDQVDVTSARDRIYWRHKLQTTDRLLIEAAMAVGSNPEDIAAYLELRKKTRLPS